MQLSPSAHSSVSTFKQDQSLFALALTPSPSTTNTANNSDNEPESIQILQPSFPAALPFPPATDHHRPTIPATSSRLAFQKALNKLESLITPRSAAYFLLRRPVTAPSNANASQQQQLVFITFVPYQADAKTNQTLLAHRDEVVRELAVTSPAAVGDVISVICKEIGEIVDGRSWDERDGTGESWGGGVGAWNRDRGQDGVEGETREGGEQRGVLCEDGGACRGNGCVRDLGFRKNKCRLCDRRMKNPIEDDALEALSSRLGEKGGCVQLHVDIPTDTLQLTSPPTTIPSPSDLPSALTPHTPSFTFYRHPTHHELYFIFFSPDDAPVTQRMKHTMAIPGLVNVIARDVGVHVDRKLEIHDTADLALEDEEDGAVREKRGQGRFRSVYLRNEFVGTESQWEGMEAV